MSFRRSTSSRRVTLALASTFALALFALTAAPALAVFRYPAAPSSTFSGSGTDALSNPAAVAVDNSGGASAHDVYVNDPANHRVEKFGPSGEFILMFGKEVNETKVLASAPESQQNVCVAGTGDVCKAGASSATAGGFEDPAFLAVDNSTPAGDVYVADAAAHSVQKFSSSGALIISWGSGGEITGIEDPLNGIAVDPSGNLFVLRGTQNVDWYEPSGTLHSTFPVARNSGPFGLAADVGDVLYEITQGEQVVAFNDEGFLLANPLFGYGDIRSLTFEPSTNDLFIVHNEFVERYAPNCNTCLLESFGVGYLSSPQGIAIDGSSGIVYVANAGAADVSGFTGFIVPTVTTASASELGPLSGTLNGQVDPEGVVLTECLFEYGETESYGHTAVCEYEYEPGKTTTDPDEIPAGSGPVAVHAALEKLNAVPYHYRLVAVNSHGTEAGVDRTFTPLTAVVEVKTAAATEIGKETAILHGSFTAEEGIQTEYYFEYGAGHKTPPETFPGTASGGGHETHEVSAEIANLVPDTTYSDRLIAKNDRGTTDGEREEFKTQQPPTIESFMSTHLTATSADLEAHIYPNGFSTRYHFEYGPTISYGTSAPLPSEEEEEEIAGELNASHSIEVPIDNLQPGVTYHFRLIADNKWGEVVSEDQSFNFTPPNCPNSHVRQQTDGEFLPDCRAYELVSPAAANGAIMFPDVSGPNSSLADDHYAFAAAFSVMPGTGEPINGINVDRYVATRTPEGWLSKYVGLAGNQTADDNTPFTDMTMDKFLSFDEGQFVFNQFTGHPHEGSSAPYVYGANGKFMERWPTNLASIPGGENTFSGSGEGPVIGAKLPSPDFGHYFFSSSKVDFAPPNGVMSAPGSVYDNNIAAGTVTIASRTPSGGPIPPGTDESSETIQLPATSTNGTHVLMATQASNGGLELYMRVNEAVSYDVSQGQGVQFLGMTSDGSKVYFTTEERLLPADTDNSTDIYMWSAEKAERQEQPLILVSIGSEGAGNSDACNVSWTQLCGAVPISTAEADFQGTDDSAIASGNGDLYFYSPEQLDGDRGVFDGENLYDYRNGRPQYVTTLEPSGLYCDENVTLLCTRGPLVRIDVAPDDSHAAFVTTSQITAYNNTAENGVCSVNEYGEPATGPRCEEMYTYDPAMRKIVCVSCDPNGEAPIGDVHASDNGLFMSDDGRAFFYTPNPLVPQDTNGLNDVYEYVDGRPQLITTGLGSKDVSHFCTECSRSAPRPAGLSGVSADGTNVFFSTYETLVPQDQNGNFLKFYDARSDGGFPVTPAAAPCVAADECHGAGSSPPAPPQLTSNGVLGGGGNVLPRVTRRHRRPRRRHHKKKRASSRRLIPARMHTARAERGLR